MSMHGGIVGQHVQESCPSLTSGSVDDSESKLARMGCEALIGFVGC